MYHLYYSTRSAGRSMSHSTKSAALGMAATHGTLAAGKAADFVLWDIERPAELAYRIGVNPCHAMVCGGAITTVGQGK